MTATIDQVPCRDCGACKLSLADRLMAAPIGSHSLAGVQMKVTARRVTWMTCDGCGANGEVRITANDHGTYDMKVLSWACRSD